MVKSKKKKAGVLTALPSRAIIEGITATGGIPGKMYTPCCGVGPRAGLVFLESCQSGAARLKSLFWGWSVWIG